MAKNSDNKAGFEQGLNELESLVETMERGDLDLEDALKSFERGVALARHCSEILKQAEQRVQILSGKENGAQLEEFNHDA